MRVVIPNGDFALIGMHSATYASECCFTCYIIRIEIDFIYPIGCWHIPQGLLQATTQGIF
jgi:hypothetical protein